MEVRVLENNKKEGKLSFLLKNATPMLANTLRRMIVDEVPTMAIEDVEIRKNSSILYDEMIAHRLGLIPLKTDLKTYDLPEDCKCAGEGCAKCTLKLVLKVKATKNDQIATAADIKSKDPKVVPVESGTPIVKLLKDQSLELEATAVLGRGKEHVKWSPGLAFFKYKPTIEIKKEPKNAEEIVKICPKGIFELKKGKLTVNKDNFLKCHLCGACTDLSPNIKLNESDTEFVFFVESWGQLKPKDIVLTAIELMQAKLDDFEKIVKK